MRERRGGGSWYVLRRGSFGSLALWVSWVFLLLAFGGFGGNFDLGFFLCYGLVNVFIRYFFLLFFLFLA